MKKNSGVLLSAMLFSAVLSAAAADGGKPDDLATGNMPDAVHGMDSNNDGMISKDEYMSFEATHYDEDQAKFATGNMTDAVKAQHASKRKAFMKQSGARFDKLKKNSEGLVDVNDMVEYLKGAGNK